MKTTAISRFQRHEHPYLSRLKLLLGRHQASVLDSREGFHHDYSRAHYPGFLELAAYDHRY